MNESVISEQGKIYSVTIFPKYRILNQMNELQITTTRKKPSSISVATKAVAVASNDVKNEMQRKTLMIFLIQIYKN